MSIRSIEWLLAVLVLVMAAPLARGQTIFYVRASAPPGGDGTSWATAFNDFQAGAWAATFTPSSELWVAEGTYVPTAEAVPGDPRSRRFTLPDNWQLLVLNMYGGFSGTETARNQRNPALHPTILSGDVQGNDLSAFRNYEDNCYNIVYAGFVPVGSPPQNRTTTILFDGFQFRGANGDSALKFEYMNVTLANCTIKECINANGVQWGGGYVGRWQQYLTVTDTAVRDIRDGAGLTASVYDGMYAGFANAAGSISLNRCRFERCGGGGAVLNGSYVTCDDTDFVGMGTADAHVGLIVSHSYFNVPGFNDLISAIPIHVRRCRFFGNYIGASTYRNVIVSSCLFAGNNTTGLRMAIDGVVEYCTFARNAADGGTAAYFEGPYSAGEGGYNGAMTVDRCIFWDNPAGNFATNVNRPAGNTGYAGVSMNFPSGSVDPLFVDPNGADETHGTLDDNYDLTAASPAIDQVACDRTVDILGRPGCVAALGGSALQDYGAYEFQVIPVVVDRAWTRRGSGSFLTGTNWDAGASPGPNDRAIFDAIPVVPAPPPLYTVTFPEAANVTNARLLVDINRSVNFRLQDFDYLMGSPDSDLLPSVVVGQSPGLDARLSIFNEGIFDGTFSAKRMVLGDAAGSIGRLTITDPPNLPSDYQAIELLGDGDLRIGKGGRGELNLVTVGNSVTGSITGSVIVADEAGSLGTLTIDGAASATGSGARMTYRGRSVNALSSFIIANNGGSSVLPGALVMRNGAQLASDGFVGETAIAKGPGSFGSVSLDGAGTLWNTSGSQLTIGGGGAAAVSITGGAEWRTSTFGAVTIGELQGSSAGITIDGAGSKWMETSSPIEVGQTASATVTVRNGGTLQAPNLVIYPGGVVAGNGIVVSQGSAAGVFNLGSIRPDGGSLRAPTGTLTINGNYKQVGIDPNGSLDSGQVVLKVGGASPGQYDRLVVNGAAELGGGLQLALINGFVPPSGQPFALELVTPTTRTGQYDVALLPGLSDGRYLRVSYGTLRGPGNGVNIGIAPLPGSVGFNNPNQNIVSGSPTGVATGDLNGDGLPDLAVTVPDTNNPTTAPGSVVVLFNGGVGPGGWNGFSSSAQINLSFNAGADQSRQPAGVAIADLDGVTGNDLAIVGASSNNLLLLKNNGSGNFVLGAAIPTGNEPRAVAAASFDGINGRDIAVANANDDTLVVYLNNGGGNFGFVSVPPRPTGRRPVSIDPFDSDGDKDLDISIANFGQGGVSGGSISVIRNTGPGGTFQPAATVDLPAGAGTSQVTTGDLNGDSRVDLVATNTDGGTVSVIVNTGNVSGAPTFAPQVELPVGSGPTSLTRVDLDQDNDLDVAVLATTQNGPRVNVLRNDTNGGTQLQFAAASELAAGPQPLFVVNADVDANGRQDLVAVNAGNLRGVDPEAEIFTIRNNSTPPCPADWDRNGQVQSADIASFVSDWFASVQQGTLRGDFDRNNQVQPADIGAFVSTWFAALTSGC